MVTAIVLAGGDASRLKPLTDHRPKAMLLVNGRPLLQHVLEAISSRGVTKIRIVVGADGEIIRTFFGDGSIFGWAITYVDQPSPDGPADAFFRGAEGVSGDVIVVPGSVFIKSQDLSTIFVARGDLLLLALANSSHVQGLPTLRGTRLSGMESGEPVIGRTMVSTGIFRITEASRKLLPKLESRSLDRALGELAKSIPISTAAMETIWRPLVTSDDVLAVNEIAMRGHQIEIGENVHIEPSVVLRAPVRIGDGTHIGANSVIGPYVATRTNCRIGSLCEISDSLLNNNVMVDSRCVIRRSILDDGANVGAGSLIPEGCIVGADRTLPAGTIFQKREE